MRITTLHSAALIYSTAALLMLGPMSPAVYAQGEGSPTDAPNESNFEEKKWQIFGRDIGFEPRLYTGAMFYDYEQNSTVVQKTSQGNSVTDTTLELDIVLPILGGGGTFFVDRFFVDVYAQHAFSQSDSTDQNSLQSIPGSSVKITQNARLDIEVERIEWAVSTGYAVTDNFALFAGYRRADTDFDGKVSGKFTQPAFNDLTFPELSVIGVTGDLTGNQAIAFDQSGPFIGLAYGGFVEKGIFNGLITFDLAVAFLDGQVVQKNTNTRRINQSSNGNPLPDSTVADSTIKLDGDAIGINLGIHWKGLTPVTGLSYLIAVVAHRYDFRVDDKELGITGGKFEEIVITPRVGITYAF